jgi:hypothetical protein
MLTARALPPSCVRYEPFPDFPRIDIDPELVAPARRRIDRAGAPAQ